MKTIPLTKGKFALVDDEDFDHLNQFKWHLSHYGYAVRNHMTRRGRRIEYMHRRILGLKFRQIGDHKDRNRLNNQRENLRRCSRLENVLNRTSVRKISPYRGVQQIRNGFCSKIQFKKKVIYIGFFRTAEDAAKAYDRKALELFGLFALPNFS